MITYLITVVGYLLFAITGFSLWFFTRGGRSEKIASLKELLSRAIRYRVTRLAMFFAWWWFGWHFIVNVVVRS